MSELLKKYESIDQSKLNEATIKIINRVKTITADFTADDEKNNKIAEQVLDSVMQKNPDAVKIVKREPKAKPAPKKTHKATHTAKATHKATSAPATKNSDNNIMTVAKQIQNAGESWKDAMERAKVVLKQRKEKVVEKKKTELEKLYALVKTKKELQGFANSDIKRDAVREAKPKGSRVVTKAGFTSNQHGVNFPNKLGRKYWETRDRHADRLAPNYPKDMPLLASGGVLPKDVLKEIYEAQEKSVKGGYFPEYESEMNYNLLVFGNNYAIEVERRNSREFPTHYYIYDTNFKYLGSAESINAKSKIDYSKLTKSDFTGTKFVGYKFDNGGSLPFMTDPNFGNFQNTGSFAKGGKFKGFKFNVGDKVMVNSDFDYLNIFYKYEVPKTFEMGYDFSKPVTIVETKINSFNKPFYKVKTAPTENSPEGYIVYADLPEALLSPAMSSDKDSDVKIKDWYMKTYPTDDLGEELNDEVTFEDMWNEDYEKYDIYQVMGVGDSVIRERLFEHLAEIKGVSYSDVYRKLFSSDGFYADGGMTDLTMQNVSFELGGVLPKDVLKEIYEAQEKSVKGGYFPEYESEMNYNLLVFGNNYAIEVERRNSREFPTHYYIYDTNFKYLGSAESINAKSKIDYSKLTKSDFTGTKFVGYKFDNGGSLPFMTDPNFGNFQNTGSFADGGSMSDLTEQEFLKKYFGANVFTENPSQYFEIKKMSSSDDNKVDAFVKELKSDGFTVKKRAFSDFTSVMGVKKKASFELGGAFMTTDLAGHTGGGTGGLNANMPLDGFSGTNYTGLVGETGAMSSGELFENGGALHSEHTDNPLKYLSLMGAKTYGDLNYSTSKNGIDYYIGRKKDKNGENKAIVVAFITDENNYMIDKEDAKEMSETAKEKGVDKVELYTNYGVELRSSQKPQILGFDKIFKVMGNYEAGGAMMQNQQVINDASQSYVNYYLNDGGGAFKDGGSIPNNYEGRTPEDIWDSFTDKQRSNFLDDHKEIIKSSFESHPKHYLSNGDLISQWRLKYRELNPFVKLRFDDHVRYGQYASGGSLGKTLYVEYSSYFDSNNYDEEKIMSALKSIGAKNIRLENDRGWSNQPEVVVFNGDKNKAEEALNEAFDTDYIRVREKDWRTKKMADGGSVDDSVINELWNGYASALLFTETDSDSGEPLDSEYSISDFDKETVASSKKMLAEYYSKNKEAIEESELDLDTIGNDIWYTRSGQGAGFFDHSLDEEVEEKLTKGAKELGEYPSVETYDGKISVRGGKVFAKGGFVGTVEFNAGDTVWQKDEKRYATVMNNYGDPINGDYGDIRLDTTGNTSIYTFDRNRKTPATVNTATGYNLVKVGEKGDTGKFTPEVLVEMKESANRLIDSNGGRKDPSDVAYYKAIYKRLLDGEFDSMVGGVKATTSNKKGSSDYTYVPNKDVKELSVMLKGELKKLMGSDILDGVYVKNSAKSAPKVDADAVFAKILKDAKEAKYENGKTKRFDASELKILNLEMIQKLVEAGYTEQQIRNVIFGYTFDNEVLAEGEFDTQSGIFGYEDSYVPKKTDSLVEAKKNNEFAVGIEYPDFDWQGIIKKYKISSKPKELVIERRAGSWGHTEYFYEVFVGENIVIGHNYGYKDFDANGKLKNDYIDKTKKVTDPTKQNAWQKEREVKAGFNSGWWTVVSSKIEIIDDVLKTLLSQKGGYCKELDFYDDSFPKNLKENNIDFELGGFMNNVYAKGGGVSGKLDSGVYRVGKPIKVSPVLYEQKIAEIFDNGDISTASDYGRKLSDFKSQKYPIITKEQLEAEYKMADGGFMNNVYAKGGSTNRFVIVEGFDSFKNRPLYQVVDKSEQGEYVGEYHTNRKDAEEELKDLKNSFADGGGVEDVSKSLSVNKFYDQDGNLMGYTIKDKYNVNGKYTLSNTKEKAEEILQYLIDNPSRLAYYRKNEYADGGEMQGNNIDAELEDFDIDNLDPFETMQYNQFVKSSGKVGALQVLINNVEGDYSQLSPELAELAEMQMSQEDWDDATMNERFEKYGYANGGMFDENQGFMRADNENNYRFPERPIHVDTLDEPIDLTDNVSYKPNEVVIESVDQDVNMNEDGRIRARMTQSNRGSAENFAKINPNAFEFIPMPTSNKHKND